LEIKKFSLFIIHNIFLQKIMLSLVMHLSLLIWNIVWLAKRFSFQED